MEVRNSILGTIKKMLGIPNENDQFDIDIIVFINMALNTLTQLGVGPKEGYSISSKEDLWEDFVGDDPRFEMVKSYLFLRTKLLFDSNQLSGAVIECYKEQMKELEWRLNVQVDPEDTFD